MKRKRKRMSPEERAARDARSEELTRRLDEHIAKIRAELEASRAAEESAG
jgi:hypothetical protein